MFGTLGEALPARLYDRWPTLEIVMSEDFADHASDPHRPQFRSAIVRKMRRAGCRSTIIADRGSSFVSSSLQALKSHLPCDEVDLQP